MVVVIKYWVQYTVQTYSQSINCCTHTSDSNMSVHIYLDWDAPGVCKSIVKPEFNKLKDFQLAWEVHVYEGY